MTEPTVYLNDRFVPASQAHVNIYDLGIVLGATLTEMTRTFKHRPFRLEDHVARLYRSCKFASIVLPLSPEEMIARTQELIVTNCASLRQNEDLGIVHFVTPGENRIYAGSAAGSARLTPTVCIHSFPLPFSAWRDMFITGAHVVTPAIRHVPPQCVDPRMKNRSRLHWWLADQQVHSVDPKAVTLLLDLDGNITECGGSNFVVIKGNVILSPPARHILQGVSLLTVRDLASSIGMEFRETQMTPYDVITADEAWLTTTPYCIAPVVKINNIPIGTGKPGPWFEKMIDAWSGKVGMDIRQQISESER